MRIPSTWASFALLVILLSHAVQAEPREIVDLNGSWKFYPAFAEIENNHAFLGTAVEADIPEKHKGWIAPGFDDSLWWDIAVPSSWNTEFEDLWSYEGQGWYRRTIDVPATWYGKHIEFISDGANYRTILYVNGKLVGTHDGGFTRFSFPIQEYLRYGETNTLAVSVDNKTLLDRVPMERHDWWQHGGLYRPVHLEVKDPAHIATVQVDTDALAEVPTVTVACGLTGRSVEMQLVGSLSYDGTIVATAEEVVLSGRISLTLNVPNAQLWSPESPNLYDLTLELREGNRVVDRYTQRVGIRSLTLEPDRLLLNGKPYILKGVNRYEDYHDSGMTNTPEALAKDIALIKGLGANAVRCHYTYAPETYELLDEAGLLAVCEVPLYQWGRPGHSEKNTEAAKAQLTEIIATLGNHPSVAMWSVSNETRTRPREPGEEHEKLSEMVVRGNRELLQLAKRLDPSRPVIAPSNRWPNDPIFSDTSLNSINVYLGVREPHVDAIADNAEVIRERFAAVREHYPNRPILVSEFGSWALRGLKTDYFPGEPFQAEFLKLHWETFMKEPGFIGAFIWAFADNDVHRKYTRIYETRCAYGLYDLKRRPKQSADVVRALWAEDTP
jgi:beta-galactosidase/beta-glucuronidase